MHEEGEEDRPAKSRRGVVGSIGDEAFRKLVQGDGESRLHAQS